MIFMLTAFDDTLWLVCGAGRGGAALCVVAKKGSSPNFRMKKTLCFTSFAALPLVLQESDRRYCHAQHE